MDSRISYLQCKTIRITDAKKSKFSSSSSLRAGDFWNREASNEKIDPKQSNLNSAKDGIMCEFNLPEVHVVKK